MTGIVATYDLDISHVSRALLGLSAWQMDELAFNIGALLESSTKRRIADEKTGPAGEPWADWSEAYAATRSPRHSLLISGGNPGLLESIQNYSVGPVAEVGTNLVYGAIQQFGGDTTQGHPAIPGRPYLGVSEEDEADIAHLIQGDLEELLQ